MQGSALISLVTALDMGLTREDTALLVMPMCHANSLYFAFTFTYLGATCVIDDHRHFDPEALLATMAAQRVTFTSLVPTHYIMALGLPGQDKGHLRRRPRAQADDLVGARAQGHETRDPRPFPQIAALRALRLDGGRLGDAAAPGRADRPPGLGRPRVDGLRAGAACSMRTRREVPDGEVGELFSRTPYTFDGYLDDPGKTAEAFRGGYCSVGDMGRRDAEGFIHLVDRKSNMIISGGENVYPSEVENLLGRYPGVKDVAVVGVPHAKWGEAVHAVIVMHDGAPPSESAVLEWCRDKIAGYKRPRAVTFIAEARDATHRHGQDPSPRPARAPRQRAMTGQVARGAESDG